MSVVGMPQMLSDARAGGYAVGYFESWDVPSLEAVVDAAQAERSPVIVGVGGMMVDPAWLERRGIAVFGAAAHRLAETASVPIAVMFNEAQTLTQAAIALTSGFNCVLLCTDALPQNEATAVTADLVRRAHAVGVSVEAELGQLPDAGRDDECSGEMTDPAEASEFVRDTGIDCLAVSIGNIHVKTDGWAVIDRARLEALRSAVDVPFAIHGGTSFPPADVPHAVANGVAKFNVGTVLKKVYWDAISAAIPAMAAASVHDLLGSRKPADCTAPARSALTAKVRELMRLYGSSGRAVSV